MTPLPRVETHASWSRDAASSYGATRHGPDGAQFLDAYFIPYLQNLAGRNVVDVGCGAGPWSIYAIQQGANTVTAIDIQQSMTSQALRATKNEGLESQVLVVQADAAVVPLASATQDIALSINVGCNLKSTSNEDGELPVGFGPHFAEIARVLKPGGRAIITAPNSFGTIFTNGDKPNNQIISEMQLLLDQLEDVSSPAILDALKTCTDVNRATVVLRNGRPIIVTHEDNLISGEPILRKLPDTVAVPNYYHHIDEYRSQAEKVGLLVREQHEISFATEEERSQYNNEHREAQLGSEYVGSAPFVVYILEKPTTA